MTIYDVAQRAKVSPSVVSFVLNGSRPVGDATRQRVRAAIDALGYTPNAAARGLRLRRTGLVACLVPYLNNPLYSLHAAGAEQELAAAGFLTIVSSTRGVPRAPGPTGAAVSGNGHRPGDGGVSAGADSPSGAVLQALSGSRVDGVLLFPYEDDAPQVARLAESGVPVVYIDREPRHASLPTDAAVDAVVVDNESGVFRATEHLLALGHRRIGLVSLRPESLSGPPRLAGYRRAFQERGLEVPEECLALGRGGPEDGEALTTQLLALRPAITALVVAVTNCTAAALRTLHRSGVRLPDDLSVVGYAHEGILGWPGLDLAAVRYPGVELGREAAKLLLTRLRAAPGEPRVRQRVVLQPELRVGSSTRRVGES
ncbi:MAG TPA: LacI family DNA-binding transcriptional regulator [Chloroflexota bacterium]|nr:LacI family DNA-binding transcriptional regulator [Chloroflexota bacterium]